MQRVICIFFATFIAFDAFAVKKCEQDVRLDLPKTYANLSATIKCVDKSSGKILEEVRFVNGKREGETKYYDINTGKLKRIEPYKNDVIHGVVKTYKRRSDKLDCETNYVNDKLQGIETCYHDNGKISFLSYRQGNGVRDTLLAYNRKGLLESIRCGEHSVHEKDRAWCGFLGKSEPVKLYDKSGSLRSIERRKDGKLHGVKEYFYPNGKLKGEVTFRQDSKHGKSTAYWENGNLRAILNYENQGLAGEQVTFFEDGKTRQALEIIKDRMQIASKEWYQNGSLKMEMLISGDKKNSKHYFDNGKVSSETQYSKIAYPHQIDWMRSGKESHYFESGQLKSQAFYGAKAKKDGEEVKYNEAGQLLEKSFWKAGVLTRKVTYKEESGEQETDESYYPDGSRK